MPRIIRIINRFNLGGITYNVSYLSKYLPEEYDTVLIGGPAEEHEQSSLFIPESLGLQPIIIEEMRRSLNPFSDYFAYRRILSMIKQFKPDIVHTHASKAGAIGRLAALRAGVPVIVHTFHGHVFKGYFGSFKTTLFKVIERFLARKSTAIVTISPLQQKEITEVYSICSAEKSVVIPLGFNLQRFTENQSEKRSAFRQRFDLKDGTIAIGIIGRLAPIKNHVLFLDAVDTVLKTCNVPVRAVIIGDGETRKSLEAYVAGKGSALQNSVVFAGWIKEIDVALSGLDLVALSSLNEGTPVSLIEAQAAGKFIVSTNVGGIADIVADQSALLSEPGDNKGFIDNLIYAVQHFEQCENKAKATGALILEKYSYQRLCRDMDQLYKTLLQQKNQL